MQKEAAEKWDAAGKLYIQENENDLKDEMDFMTDVPEHYPVLGKLKFKVTIFCKSQLF